MAKCQLFEDKVWYLKNIISTEELITNPEKLRAIREWPISKNEYEIRSFVGLCLYYRWFISGFTNIAKPLNTRRRSKPPSGLRCGGRLSNTVLPLFLLICSQERGSSLTQMHLMSGLGFCHRYRTERSE
jgi:hypothetical protein